MHCSPAPSQILQCPFGPKPSTGPLSLPFVKRGVLRVSALHGSGARVTTWAPSRLRAQVGDAPPDLRDFIFLVDEAFDGNCGFGLSPWPCFCSFLLPTSLLGLGLNVVYYKTQFSLRRATPELLGLELQ